MALMATSWNLICSQASLIMSKALERFPGIGVMLMQRWAPKNPKYFRGPFHIFGSLLKWWVSPTTIGFPTKNDDFGV